MLSSWRLTSTVLSSACQTKTEKTWRRFVREARDGGEEAPSSRQEEHAPLAGTAPEDSQAKLSRGHDPTRAPLGFQVPWQNQPLLGLLDRGWRRSWPNPKFANQCDVIVAYPALTGPSTIKHLLPLLVRGPNRLPPHKSSWAIRGVSQRKRWYPTLPIAKN
ncbi:hypothetical protein GGS23DRAFT_576787 [Durotheca rogersii]|uniref:uncharacterized protein n=1 Tax=Durotheca rogersii TaxID=419775 RepID=UPI00221FE929|nr:uncharacterized protein GGS23DRAFT_576787 [Durotheca rogersii]KAI5861430.1 hypothetical protein GGS23DRAFT_576787 [Durotheca rogersii]